MPLRFFLAIFLITCCFISKAQDSDSTSDCFEKFFKSGEKVANQSKIQIIQKNKKIVSLAGFMKQLNGEQQEIMLKDLDQNGKKELVIYSFTGGAHCCDQFYFFKNIAPEKYQLTSQLSGGDVCVNKDVFIFSFTEHYGYFFTCYACSFPGEEERKRYAYPGGVSLKYKNGRLHTMPGDEKLKHQINSNLLLISKLKWDGGASDTTFDDGRRKEVAMNLATYYFSFGKNITDTKALFTKYYKFKDATKVWTAFAKTLSYLQANNNL